MSTSSPSPFYPPPLPSPSTKAPFSAEALAEREAQACQEQSRQRWESLRLELRTKLQLLHKTLEQEHQQPVKTPYRKTGMRIRTRTRLIDSHIVFIV